MPIEFRSGLPGSSKTLGAVDHLMELRKTAPERPVYVLGITDLREGLALPLTVEQLENWQELPPNSIIVVDECQRYMPARRAGDPPRWIKDLSTHRHLGLDFILISQHPALIDNYVRRLIDRHIHHVRKYGTEWCDRWEWPELQSEPTSSSAKKAAHSKKMWKFSKTAMEAYKSAEVHTVKRRLPPILYIMVVSAVAIPLLFWFAWHHMRSAGKSPTLASVAADEGKGQGGSGSSGKAPESTAQWIKDRVPRVAGIPWSAPIYDKQSVASIPDLYCASMQEDDGSVRCTCLTEQGTHADVPGAVCLKVANDGIYNPYRKSLVDASSSGVSVSNSAPPTSQMSPAPSAYPTAAVPSIPATGAKGGSSSGGIHGDYVPPTDGNWQPETFAGRK